MAGTIKGITIEFRGDTTKLDSALKDINKNTRSLDKELRAVDKALKFNPTSVELWRQKQDLLRQKIGETKDKLDVLKQAQAKMDAQGVGGIRTIQTMGFESRERGTSNVRPLESGRSGGGINRRVNG